MEVYTIDLDKNQINSKGYYPKRSSNSKRRKKSKKYLPVGEFKESKKEILTKNSFDKILSNKIKKQESIIDENNNFKLSLQPGEYRIIAYEDINPIDQSYFSGTLEPFKQSAKFTVYNDIIRIRANWTNTIKMKLE